MKHRYVYCIIASLVLSVYGCKSKNEPAAEAPPQAPQPEVVQPQSPEKTPPKQPTEAFFEAALTGDIQTVKAELIAGVPADATTPDGQGRTALMLAAFNGHTELIEMLIDYGGDVNAVDGINRTALMYASSGPFPETVQLLIDKGAKVNIIDNNEKWTALMFAAAEGHADSVKRLLKAGADTTFKDIDGDTAADFAAQKGRAEIAEMIRQYGQSSDSGGPN
ncbi:MAG: ankyrin repeat domain-containing protein [Planctomycetota bacterium]|jgi:ankyrin repeat protein